MEGILPSTCSDTAGKEDLCADRKGGYCSTEPWIEFLHRNCKKSCGSCGISLLISLKSLVLINEGGNPNSTYREV